MKFVGRACVRALGASLGVILWAGVAHADTNSAATYLNCLIDFQRYGDSVWFDAGYANSPPGSGYFGDGASGGNGGIRGSCGVAVAYAVLAQALPADPARPARIDKIRKALNYAANTHVSGTNVCNDGKKWGHDWQTAEWAGSMGLACLLVQNDLPAATVQACQRAVADEATYRASIAPGSGYVGDTKAEENAWDSNILALGAAWLSTNTNATLWLTGAKKYLANSYTVANTNGDPLASWITTVTLYPDFALENHGFYHPTYEMVAGMSLGDSLLMARLANPAIAAQLQPFAEHNVLNVWGQLSHMVVDCGEFAYPSGLDWALHDYEQNSYYTWLAFHFNDPLARRADGQMAELERYRQMVNGDGRFVGESETDVGFYREAVEAKRTAIAWLHVAHADFTNGPVVTPDAYVAHWPDVELISQRGPFGFVSISYGSRIMGLITPPAVSAPTNVYVTTPRLPGILGLGALGNPTAAQLVRFATNDGGFEAELQLQHGTLGATEVYVKSTGETIGIVEVPWPASGIAGGVAGSFSVGVENDPLCGNSRLVEWSGGSTNITGRSGVSRAISNRWVCVSGQLGTVAGPAGYFRYQAAASYNRLGAAQDTVDFVPDQPLGARYAVWFPGKTAAATAAAASSVTWTNSSPSNSVLTFPGPNGGLYQITALLPPPSPPYQPYAAPVSGVTASSSQAPYPPTLALDGNAGTFWVSNLAPRTNSPQTLSFSFARNVGIMGFDLTPRIGYGPRTIIMSVGTNQIFAGSMADATLSVRLPQSVEGTNALLVITWSYDPQYPGNPAAPRNAQVAEIVFYERAAPGTFGDWSLRQFTDQQLADPAVGAALADPDGDGVPNLMEFAVGGNPVSADASAAAMQLATTAPGTFSLRFQERKNLGDVQRHFESSTDLVHWTEVIPSQLTTVGNLPNAYLRQAMFPVQGGVSFFRVRFLQVGS